MATVTVALNNNDNSQISGKNYSCHSERISVGKFKKMPKFILDEAFIRTDFVRRFLVFSVST